MRNYELVLVIRPSVAQAARKKLVDTIVSWLKDVKVKKQDDLGQKALAFPIKHETTGFYIDMQLEAGGVVPLGFEQRLVTQENVLRHLLVRTK